MSTEIAPGVHWIDCGSSNLYLCVEADGLTLIDTGTPKQAHWVWQLLDSLGRPRTDLKQILLTHADMDHAGSAAALQLDSQAKLYGSAATLELVSGGKSPRHMPALIQLLMDWVVKYPAVPSAVMYPLTDGDKLSLLGGMQVIATPGHTLDHLSYFLPRLGVLFVGDAMNTRNGRLQITPPRITADQQAARDSAIRLLELSPAVIACGHGTPLTNQRSDDWKAFIKALRQV